jgi:hypothetical protein
VGYHPRWRWGSQPEVVVVPTLVAGLVASAAGWAMDDMLQPLLGTSPTLVLSFLGSTLLFFAMRKWLVDLRGR